MRTAKDLLEQARKLPARERQKLIRGLQGIDQAAHPDLASRKKALRDFLAMAGKGASGRSDVSSNKTKHFAAVSRRAR
jgi:hypothetical protein